MAQEDFLKKEIDKMARALTSILLSQIGFKNLGDIQEVVNYAQQSLINELDLDLDNIAEIPDDTLITLLITHRHLNNSHLNTLADIIFNSAKALQQDDGIKAKKLFQKALIIYNYLSVNEKNYSFEWHDKMIAINKII